MSVSREDFSRGECHECGWRGLIENGCGPDCSCAVEAEPEPEDERDMDDAKILTLTRTTTHTARKVHAGRGRDGRWATDAIKPGQRYRRVVEGGYVGICRDYPEGGGPRWMEVRKVALGV